MNNFFSRKIFYIFTLGVIIFLTGCARGGYHRPIVSSVPPPAAGWPQASVRQGFVWPLRDGELLFGFGAKEDRVSLKGIVIRAKAGDRVLAARDGRVKLVDQKLKGYGKTIILEHPLGFYTVYARNSEIMVVLGQWVRQGDQISRSPQLYFEIRKNAKVEDPLVYLRKN